MKIFNCFVVNIGRAYTKFCTHAQLRKFFFFYATIVRLNKRILTKCLPYLNIPSFTLVQYNKCQLVLLLYLYMGLKQDLYILTVPQTALITAMLPNTVIVYQTLHVVYMVHNSGFVLYCTACNKLHIVRPIIKGID